MSSASDRIVLLAVKHTVIAFDKQTGARLWTHDLGGGLTGDFVTVLADAHRVFAHARGRFFCLDLITGAELWHDELSGMGYGLASIAVPGLTPATTPVLAAERAAQDDSTATTAGGAS